MEKTLVTVKKKKKKKREREHTEIFKIQMHAVPTYDLVCWFCRMRVCPLIIYSSLYVRGETVEYFTNKSENVQNAIFRHVYLKTDDGLLTRQ